ncbi:hypothetical protein [Ammoniphilus sp. CFH 90114]|uniref:hypothetical protein n=1 Tax=Ammoniphilus sp. CFH 90114 TaxID=2493665 RepID=UPI00100E4023|nr:hypothetical protein [Ammoniphilus sp. CFH 90114]RXT04150.1 hypothetical protein EIZ39_21475 [Ammoniphilus sp. CFH 90114]
MSLKLVAVRMNEEGKITHFLTDKDTVLTIEEAEKMALQGELDSLSEIHEDGSWIIDAVQPIEGHNLDQLPRF